MARRAGRPFRSPPRIDDELTPADVEQLADDREWTDLEISGDLNALDAEGVGVSACRIVHAQLSGSDLWRARLVDTLFVDCDLSGMLLDAGTLIRVEFRNCRLSGLVLHASTGCRDVLIGQLQGRRHQRSWRDVRVHHGGAIHPAAAPTSLRCSAQPARACSIAISTRPTSLPRLLRRCEVARLLVK